MCWNMSQNPCVFLSRHSKKKLVQHFYFSSLFLQKAAAVNDPSCPVDYLRVIETINDLAQSQEHQHDRTIEFVAQELALALLALDQDQGYRWDDQILFHFLNGRWAVSRQG